MSSPRGGHDASLDGLRGLAILLVIVAHTVRFSPQNSGWQLINAVTEAGWIGVDLFFVLSGFLITRILLETRDDPHRVSNFYARRALRILPAYIVYLGLVFLVLAFTAGNGRLDEARTWLLSHLLFMQNLHSAAIAEQPIREMSHLWSLAVEEQFYLLWPWLVWSFRTALLSRLCLVVIGLAWTSKVALVYAGAWHHTIYILPFTRMDGFAIGALIAAQWHLGMLAGSTRLSPVFWLLLMALGALFLLCESPARLNAWQVALATTLSVLMFGVGLKNVLLSTEQNAMRQILSWGWLRFLGRYSYGLYLLHFGVDTWVRLFMQPLLADLVQGQWLRLLTTTVSMGLSLLLALLLHRWVEAPALALKKHFAASPTSAQRGLAETI